MDRPLPEKLDRHVISVLYGYEVLRVECVTVKYKANVRIVNEVVLACEHRLTVGPIGVLRRQNLFANSHE